MADIDLSELPEWEPVWFAGVFDGNGHCIKAKDTTVFGTVHDAVIENLGVESKIVTTSTSGIVKLLLESKMNNCFFDGSITIDKSGGLIETAISSQISNCYNAADIESGAGIALQIDGVDISNCFNTGNIGFGGGIVYQCSGNFDKTRGEMSTVTNCFNLGNIGRLIDSPVTSGKASNAAGIVNSSLAQRLEISNCFNSGDIIGTESAGILANSGNNSFVLNCYNSGTISDEKYESYKINTSVGISEYSQITNCYNVGFIDNEKAGGISGDLSKLEYCYFLDTTSEPTPKGALFANVLKLTSAEMSDKSSFVGFDFDTVWEMGETDYPYPVFKAVYE